jgi:hypothetical protein
VGGDSIILDVGDFGKGGRCSSGGSNALTMGKGDGVLRAVDDGDPAAGGGILGTGGGGGPDRFAIHDLPAP